MSEELQTVLVVGAVLIVFAVGNLLLFVFDVVP